MPCHDYKCKKCKETAERYVRFSELGEAQRCECGGVMERQFPTEAPYFKGRQKPKSMSRPSVRGLDSGPGGFLNGRTENAGCGSRAQMARLQRNLAAEGMSLGGGVFVPGLCRKGRQEDPFAVVHSKEEMTQKAEQLGRCLEDRDGVVFQPTLHDEFYAKQEAPYRCSPDLVKEEVAQDIKELGGKVSKTKKRDLIEKHVALHSGNG